jgi:hypothetical protein
MTVLLEGRHPGEFLLSEANGQRSREEITIASGSGIIAPGAVLGVYASGAHAGKYSLAPAVAADPDVGNQVAVAVALYGCDATTSDRRIAVIRRDAEVNGTILSFASSVDDAAKRAAKTAQLAAVGIIVR